MLVLIIELIIIHKVWVMEEKTSVLSRTLLPIRGNLEKIIKTKIPQMVTETSLDKYNKGIILWAVLKKMYVFFLKLEEIRKYHI